MALKTVTGRAFAKLHGTSHTTVQAWIADGRIPANPDGRIPLAAANRAMQKMRAEDAAPTAAAVATADAKAANLRAQVREREAKAEERELKLRRERGELVELVEVEADARRAAERIRQRLLVLPSRAAPLVAAVAPGPRQIAETEALLVDEVNAALAALNQTRFGGAA